jgi:hypothetical protein
MFALNEAFGGFFNVARTSVRLHPMRTEVRTTTATLKFLYIKVGAIHELPLQLCSMEDFLIK